MSAKKEHIPVRNYIILALIVVATVVTCLLLRSTYLSNESYKKDTPVIRDYIISEINTLEVYNYVRENENTILYMCTSRAERCRTLEESFGPYIKKHQLEGNITYLNMSSENHKNTFKKEFNKFYGTKLLGYPSLVIFEEGKVKDILTTKNSDLSLDSIKEFFKRNNISSDYYD